jgi:hypothetical protein
MTKKIAMVVTAILLMVTLPYLYEIKVRLDVLARFNLPELNSENILLQKEVKATNLKASQIEDRLRSLLR